MKIALVALTLSLVLIAGTTSFAFAQTTHSATATTTGTGTPNVFGDTTASINYCQPNPTGCHIDFQDSDGVATTSSPQFPNLNFAPGCPVGTPGVFNGAWSHAVVGSLITVTACDGFVSIWELVSETEVVLVSPVVGGDFLALDNTTLVLAGLQSSAIWMLPALAGIAGVGAYFIRTRMTKE